MFKIKIHYGPYEAYGIVRHRTQRLYGLQEKLICLGYDVELVPSKHWDRVEIEIAGRNVFTCRLTFLEYNCECKDDPLCCKAVEAVKETLMRMSYIPTLQENFKEQDEKEYSQCLSLHSSDLSVSSSIDVPLPNEPS